MTGEITLKSTLLEARDIIREELRLSSAKYNCLEPARGMEESWAQALTKVRILEAHIHALDDEGVRKALYEWKKGAQEYGTETEEKEHAEKDKRPEPEAGANVKGYWHAG